MSIPWAASPPRALPGISDHIELRPIQGLGENAGGRVANGEALPVHRDPVRIGHTHTRCGSVPGKDDIASKIDLRKIG